MSTKNILVVDDSALMRRVICDIINSDSNFQATDFCRDGLEAYERLKEKTYDGVVLDVNMPRMDGLELLERLQKENIKATVIMVSTLTTKDAEVTIMAMELGAVDFVTKPNTFADAKSDQFKRKLLEVLSAVLLKKTMGLNPKPVAPLPKRTEAAKKNHGVGKGNNRIVALACSTGGPKSLQSVIPKLPKNLNAPMVLVQHMPAGFTKSMADRLNDISEIEVVEAKDGDKLQQGVIYIAPGGRHMEVKKQTDGTHKIVLNDMPAIGGLRPCANITYDSLSNCGYDEVVCVVLTGMGADGTNGIVSLEQHKPVHVIAQDEASSVVYGMPKAIYEAGAVDEVVALDDVAQSIINHVGVI